MSLYNKYRPQSLKDLVGNDLTAEYLTTALSKPDTFPHAVLLHGPTGCGKTTVARIIARELGAGEMDLRELNTADFRGIDMVRELIRNSRYQALQSERRVWLVDECHKLTTDAQHAILKLLEDPPVHAYFVLATTEPEKLLKTIRGRCQELKMQPLTDRQMFGLLRSIAKAEGTAIKKSVYDQIIRDSLGHPRNAIQILEQVLSVSEDQQVEVARVAAEEYSQSIELCRALIRRDSWTKVSSILKGLKDQDAESIRRHVLGYAQAAMLGGDNPQAAHVVEEFWEPLFNIGFPGLVYCAYSSIK